MFMSENICTLVDVLTKQLQRANTVKTKPEPYEET